MKTIISFFEYINYFTKKYELSIINYIEKNVFTGITKNNSI